MYELEEVEPLKDIVKYLKDEFSLHEYSDCDLIKIAIDIQRNQCIYNIQYYATEISDTLEGIKMELNEVNSKYQG